MTLAIRLDRESATPGEGLGGQVVARERLEATAVQVTLAFTETVGSDFTRTMRELPLGRIHEGVLEPGVPYGFSVQVPEDALPSARLHLAKLEWRVHVLVERIGRNLSDWTVLRVTRRRDAAPPPAP